MGRWGIKLGDFIGKTAYIRCRFKARWKVGFPCKMNYLSEGKSGRKSPRIGALIRGQIGRKSATGENPRGIFHSVEPQILYREHLAQHSTRISEVNII